MRLKDFLDRRAELAEIQGVEVELAEALDQRRLDAVGLQPLGEVVGMASRAAVGLVNVIEKRT